MVGNNTVDTQGDEGALFSAELLNVELSDAQLAAIQSEDDSVQILVDGELVQVEASDDSFSPLVSGLSLDGTHSKLITAW